jgi:hypothetical protein
MKIMTFNKYQEIQIKLYPNINQYKRTRKKEP